MRRGEIRLVDLEPVRGAEANKRIGERVGGVPNTLLSLLDEALRLHLAL